MTQPPEEKAPVTYRSVSQAKSYLKSLGGCPYQYYLERRVRAWKRPAAWFAHGTAFHTVGEKFEESDRNMTVAEAKALFVSEYLDEINEELGRVPNHSYWFASGPYKGMDDIFRRMRIGQEMVENYIAYRKANPHEVIWRTPDEKRGLELGFEIDLEGVKVRGYIDQVLYFAKYVAKPWLHVRDLKTGADPGPPFQLKVYGIAVEDQYPGKIARTGDYWMAKTAKPRKPVDLTLISRAEITDLFHEADEGIRAENWEPNPHPDKCHRCPVATACEFYVGPKER